MNAPGQSPDVRRSYGLPLRPEGVGAPAVSVMVSVFNSERYLPACLASLRRQTLRDFEAILVDPGSEDRSPEICRRQAAEDSRFRYLRLQGSQRVSYCRARAVEESRAPSVAILDSDDLARPRRLERQMAHLKAHPETVLVGSYYRVINSWGWMLRLSPIQVTEDIEIRWRLTFGNCLTHSTIMFRRDAALRAGNYNPQVRAGEDLEFYSRMLGQGRFEVIPEVLGAWRVHKTSLSHIEAQEHKNDFIFSIQNAIRRELSQEASPAVASALYNQSQAPAEGLGVFREALALITQAEALFRERYQPSAGASRLLGRCVFLQLVHLMTRNSRQPWWGEACGAWIETTRKLAANADRYQWFRDAGLTAYYKSLLKSDLRFLFMKDLY